MNEIKVTLGEYKNIKLQLDSPSPSVTIDEVEMQKQYIASEFAEVVSVEGPLENGHTSVIDFVGSVDGVEFDGGSAQNFELVIGSGAFIPGFEDQMVGMTKGETRIVKVRFPDNYTPELSGKDADFKVTLHDIKTKTSKGIDEGVLKRFTEAQKITNINTLEELDKFLWDAIYRRKAEAVDKEIGAKIEKLLLENCKVEIPESILNEQIEGQIKSLENYAQSNGMDLSSMLSMLGQDEATFKDSVKDMATGELSLNAIFNEIAKTEGLSADDKDVEDFYEAGVKQGGWTLEMIKQKFPEDTAKTYINGLKVASYLRNNAQIDYKN